MFMYIRNYEKEKMHRKYQLKDTESMNNSRYPKKEVICLKCDKYFDGAVNHRICDRCDKRNNKH